MLDAEGILKDVIVDFSIKKLVKFFRQKTGKFAQVGNPLETYNGSNFLDFLHIGEIRFSHDEKLIIIGSLVETELGERTGKKKQYEKAKLILKELDYTAGIFIFYDKNGNFRFSLIYDIPKDNMRDWNNFRRFTYFVSKEFTNKTFLQRVGGGDFSSVEKIKDAFSVEKVTKEFYEDIANWYFWAVQYSTFPKDAEVEENGRNIAVIRLITRIIFIWFMREKGLVPKNLFKEKSISTMLKEISPKSSTYYQAILQNLFFATLNTKIKDRKFRREESYQGKNIHYMDHNIYRYQDYFKDKKDMLTIFRDIPFLNGGLFDCLDRRITENGKNIEIRVDGFTDKEVGLKVPDFLFFSNEIKVDLNEEYGTNNQNYKVNGLINILSFYNFTIDENDPNDSDIALDPELLGKVFENLLASFNPETSSTARKATGSYYTPREIVNYMVTQSLKEYFKTNLAEINGIEKKLEILFSYENTENPFKSSDTLKIVKLIDDLRIVDPAVGSGAFPMGALNKLVFILNKVDPKNELWKQAQLSAADTIPDPRIKQDTKNRIEEFFKGKNADYGRKLYLIQKCIYGVDIQQIAVEIAKLRFFISLLVDEKIDKMKENWGIEPLPNLDFKIMQGDSLISEFLGIDFDDGQEKQEVLSQIGLKLENEDDNLIKEFERKKIDYQNESDKDKKAKLKNEIEDLIVKIFESKLKKQKGDYFRQLQDIENKWSYFPNKEKALQSITREKEELYKQSGLNLEVMEKQLRNFTSGTKVKPFFAWKLYFVEVFYQKGGFDVVIGNPPYGAEYPTEYKRYFQDHFESAKTITEKQKGSLDTFSLFIDQGLNLTNNHSVLTYIIPMAITSSEAMTALHNKMFRACETIYISTYSNRPKKIFDSADQRVAIIICHKNNKPTKNLFTTKVNKRYEDTSVQQVIDDLAYVDSYPFVKYGRLPKVGTSIELEILGKLYKSKTMLADLYDKGGEPIYYRSSGGRYYNIITNFPTSSTKEKSIIVRSEYRDLIAAILSSNLYFWFYHIYSNNLDLKSYELEILPIPIKAFNKKCITIIENLYDEYLKDLHKNSKIKKVKYANVSEYREYYARYSKHIIDRIDLAIREPYGLTDNESSFIVNYDLKFRTNCDEVDE